MMTAILERPAAPAPASRRQSSNFAGTLGLLRLYLRRDRIVLPLWVLLLSVPLASVYVGSITAIYPTVADRAAFAATIMASPAQRAVYGVVYNDSLGAVGIWKASMFHLLIGVAVILTVIRHTRAEEENGRAELMDSTVVGRYASLTAALLLAAGASMLTGLIGFAGLLTLDIPSSGSLAFCSALAASGLVFTAVAGVAAQLSSSARTARGMAFAVLGAAFALRAIGDAGVSWMSWLSPLGWSLQVRPFAGDHWWVLGLHLCITVVLTAVAYQLLARRDVGAGLLAQRPGPPTAAPGLRGAFGLAWRLDRAAVFWWIFGLALYALLIGSVTHGIGDEIGNSTVARDMIIRMGGTSAMEQAMIVVAFNMLGMVAAAFGISLALRLHQEESAGRAEPVLAAAVSRNRWLASHLVIALAGTAAAMLIAGWITGLTYGIAANDVNAKMLHTLGTAAVQLPAVWLPVSITVALFGLLPRFTPVAWGALVAFIAVFMLGSMSGFPQWIQDLQPFSHVPHVGDGGFTAAPLLGLLALDIVLIALGAIGFRRRDLRG